MVLLIPYRLRPIKLLLILNFSENKLIFQVGEVSITKDDTLFLKGKGQEHKIQERVDSIKVSK